jgi:hypothetical protein
MIVRILGDRQYDVPEALLSELESLDEALNQAIEAGDEPAVASALDGLITKVRGSGTPLDSDQLVPSDLTLPHEGSSLAELHELLASEPDRADPVTEGA